MEYDRLFQYSVITILLQWLTIPFIMVTMHVPDTPAIQDVQDLTKHITAQTRYEPTWQSLDTRPIPEWFDDVKFGIFIVWGVYSVPSFESEWFWYAWRYGDPGVVKFMKDNYPPQFTYADFASKFTAEFYDPNQWADIIEASGAKYFVLTTKHHDGFTLWPSNVSFNWNSMDVGPKRDLVGDLSAAIRRRTKDVHVGLYHSMFEWFNPLYEQDSATGFKTQTFVQNKAMPELYELVNSYKPDVIWSDGDWLAPYTYWNSTEFIAWLYNDSPVKDTVVVNDRWGSGIPCHHGDFYTCSDRYNPGKLQLHKWENCMTIDVKSWGYRREAPLADYLTIEQLIAILAETVSCGGNLLMNVGPTHDGRIVPVFEERLRQMGQWLKVNGDAIYSTKPCAYQNDTISSDIWYTCRKSPDGSTLATYAILLKWPDSNNVTMTMPVTTVNTRVSMLGYTGHYFKWTPGAGGNGVIVYLPAIPINRLPSTWAWVLKLEELA